jgi:hypothetical protein
MIRTAAAWTVIQTMVGRGGLDRHSDNGGSKVATERTPAIYGLAGSARKFLAVVRRAS